MAFSWVVNFTISFQLVGVLNGDTELTLAEMQECIMSRVSKKPIVTIELSSGRIEVRQESKCILSSTLVDICAVLRTALEQRAVAFSAFSCGTYTSVILMAMKKTLLRRANDAVSYGNDVLYLVIPLYLFLEETLYFTSQ